MKKFAFFTVFCLLFVFVTKSQEQEYNDTQKKGFLIISASKNYKASKKLAEIASKKLGYKLNLRGLQSNDKIGLTFSKEVCENEGGIEFPSYVPRGRESENIFVSVEYTNAYKGFTKGLYIVVVACFPKDNPELKKTLAYVKKHYKNAYIKYADVYLGCIH